MMKPLQASFSKFLALCLFVFAISLSGWGQVQLSEGFESGMPTSYTTGTAALGSGTWSITNVIRGTTGANGGSYSCQLQSATGSSIISPNITGGVGTVTFYVTSSTSSGSLQVNYSTDGGSNWTAATGSPFSSLGTSTVQKTATINSSAANILVQFYRTGATIYLDDISINTLKPTTQASAITFSSVASTSMTINWTNGNGIRRAVFMKSGSGAITNPSDGVSYTPSANWSSKGNQLGSSGYYCIYDGAGSSVSMTNLAASTTYYVQVFEYNANSSSSPTAGSKSYDVATATGNPNNQATTAGCTTPGTPVCSTPAAVCTGTAATITGAGSSPSASTYTYWDAASGGNAITISTTPPGTVASSNLTTPTSLAGGSYSYYVQGENGSCVSATRQKVTVTVNSNSTAPTGISGGSASCANGSNTITLSPSGGTLGTGANYQWGTGTTVGAAPISGATGTTYSPTVAAGTNSYWVSVANTSVCTNPSGGGTTTFTGSTSTVAIAPTTVQNISSNTNGSLLTVTDGTSAVTSHQWYSTTTSGSGYVAISGATGTTYTPNFASANTYYVVCKTTYGSPCNTTVTSNEITVVVSNNAISCSASPLTFCYNNTAPTSVQSSPNYPTVPYTLTGSFNSGNNLYLQLSDNSRSFASPTQIGSASGVTTSGTLYGTMPVNLAAGNYRIRIVSTNPVTTGTDNGTDIVVSNQATPSVSIALTTGTTPSCAGTSLTFTATPTNGGASPSYQWKVNGTNAGTNSPTFTTSALTDGQVVSCVMTTSLSCVTSATATSNSLTQNISAVPTVSISGTTTACGSVSLTASGTGTSYSWSTGSPANAAANTFTTVGTYTVTVTSTLGSCTATVSSSVTVNTNPTVSISGTTTACGSVSLSASGTGASYAWSSGSPANAAANTFSAAGNYTVTVTSTLGSCTATASSSVTVNAVPTGQATGLTYTATSATAGTLNWTRGIPGGGTNILVVANSGTVNAPSSGTAYTPSTNVASPMGTTGTGSVVVYNSTGNSQAITGLTAGTAYTFAAYEFNSPSNCYLTTSAPTTTTPGTSVSVSTLTGFTYVNGSGPSATQTFTLTGTKLSGNITVTAPADYEISSASATVPNTYVSNGSTLTFAPSSGSVSATITVRLKAGLAVGSYNSESITCAALGANSSTVTCSGTVTLPVPVVTGNTSLTATQWSAYSYNVSATNSPTSYTVLSGALPGGLSLASGTGVISGTPTTTGIFNFSIQATNAGGSGSASFTIVVSACSPATQASAATVSALAGTSLTLSWTSSTNVIVVATPGASAGTAPSQGTSYTANAAYTSGQTLGSGKVVYIGSANTVNITALTAATQYTFAVYAYNSGTTCYNTSSPSTATVTTYCTAGATTSFGLPADYNGTNGGSIMSSVSVGSISNTNSNTTLTYHDYTSQSTSMTIGNSYSISIAELANYNVTTYASDNILVWVDWDNSGVFGNNSNESYTLTRTGATGASTATFSGTITPPVGAVTGSVRMRIRLVYNDASFSPNVTPCGTSGYGEVEDYTINVVAPCTPPATQASSVTAPSIAQTTATVSIGTRGSGSGVILVAYPGSSAGTTPTSGNTYTANAAYGTIAAALGTGYVVYSGTAAAPINVNVTGLTANTQYTFVAYEYATTGTCYNTTTTGSTTFTTLPNAPSCASSGLSPSSAATGVCYSGSGAVSSISWTSVSTATSYDVYFGTSASPSLVSTAQVGTSYTTGTLSANTTYYWKVVPKNSGGSATGCSIYSFTTSGAICYCAANGTTTTAGAITNVTFNTINNSTALSCSATSKTSGYINTGVSTTVTAGSAYTLSAKVNTDYANSYSTYYAKAWIDWNQDGVFSTSNEEYDLGSAYNVCNGATSLSPSVVVPTNAVTGTTVMRVMVRYSATLTPCLTGIDGQVQDYTINVIAPCTPPTTQASLVNFTMTSASAGTLSWTKGSAGDGILVVGSTSTVTDPTQGSSYSGTTAFGTGATTASGSYVLFSSTSGTSVPVTGLTAATNFSVYEYNSSTNCYKTPAATAVIPLPVVTGTTISGTVGTVITTYTGYATNYPTTYSYTGTLPAGLSFNTSTGAISGTPTATSSNVIAVTATNIAGSSTPVNISFNISSCPATQLVFTTQPSAGQNINEQTAFSVVVTAQCSNGSTATGLSSGSVTIKFSGCGLYLGSALATGGTALTASFVNGVATFSNVKVGRSPQSNVSFTTTNTGTGLTLINDTSNTFNVIAPAGSSTTAVTVKSNDFEGTNPTPWLYNNTTANVVTTAGSGGSSGSDITGTKTYNGNTFLRKSYSVNNGSGERGTQNVITFDQVSGLSSYTYVDFTFDVASSTGLSNLKGGRGDDLGEDFVMDVNIDGGGWTTILTHTGYSNKYFDFATSPVLTLTSNSNTVISASDYQSAFKLTLPSGTSSFQFRITASNNRLEESWDIDNVKLVGTTITGGTPTALPSVSVTGGDLICGSTSTTLSSNVSNAQGAVTYSWSPTTGLSSPSVAAPTASPTSTTSYSLTITDAQGCKATPPNTADVNLILPQIVLPTITTTSGGYCDAADGFRYYQVAGSSPATYFFAIKWDPRESSTVKNAATVKVTCNATGPYSSTSTSNLDGSVLMRRYWDVKMNGQTFLYPVDVKFYYDQNEKDTITIVKNTNKAAAQTASGQTMYDVPFKWFKTVGKAMSDTVIGLIHGNNFSRFNSISLADANGSNASTDGGVLYARFNSVASFSGGTGGTGFTNSNNGLALPVTLLYLTATPKDNSYIELDWATASEINNRGFEIERSTDGVSYQHIGWVDGHGNSNTLITYSLNDRSVDPNVMYYYRLRQVDIDGNEEYSNIVSASIIGEKGFIMGALLPNPASSQVVINVVTDNIQSVDISVTDMLGREVLRRAWQLSVGANSSNLDISALSQGVYHVTIRSANSYYTKVLAVTR